MLTKSVGRVLIAASVLVALAGCASTDSGNKSGAQTRVVAADNGDITIPADPERVVATGYAVASLIEAKAPLVGISDFSRSIPLMSSDQLATYQKLPRVAGESAAETNYEAVAELKPDLIVLGVPKPALGDIDVKRLESIAPVVAIGPSLPSQWRENSRRQADAAGSLAGFDAAKETYDAKAAELSTKYGSVVPTLKFGHVGAYGQVAAGTFQREFDGSWGTNIAQDVGVKYYGQVKVPGAGSKAVSEYPALDELPASLAEAQAITYSVKPDGSIPESVARVLNSSLWQNLPAVKAGNTFAIRYTEASTYGEATKTLDSIDQAFAPLLQK